VGLFRCWLSNIKIYPENIRLFYNIVYINYE
jgi:hypothetical protein